MLKELLRWVRARKNRRSLCRSWKRYPTPVTSPTPSVVGETGTELEPMGGTPTFTSPLHYDSGQSPGIHFDLFYNPGVGNVHTLLSIDVTCDVGSPYSRMNIRHPDGTEWVSPVIPPGTGHFTQAQINAQGFTVLEDCASFTASP